MEGSHLTDLRRARSSEWTIFATLGKTGFIERLNLCHDDLLLSIPGAGQSLGWARSETIATVADLVKDERCSRTRPTQTGGKTLTHASRGGG